MDERGLVSKNEDKSDMVSKTKTIYDAGIGEIFWKNFLVGLSRGLGGIFVYLIFFFIISVFFYTFVLPKLMPSITGYMDIFKSLGSISKLKSNPSNTIPGNLNINFQKLLGQ